VKFTRHLAAALLAVAVVVALGVAWEHSSAARMIAPSVPAAGGAGFRKIAQVPPLKAGHGNIQVIRGRGVVRVINPQPESGGLNVSDLQNLTRTAEIEAALAAAVVALSLVRRSRRRARTRARLRTAGQTAAAGPEQPGPETAV
jgi:ribosomal protein L36